MNETVIEPLTSATQPVRVVVKGSVARVPEKLSRAWVMATAAAASVRDHAPQHYQFEKKLSTPNAVPHPRRSQLVRDAPRQNER